MQNYSSTQVRVTCSPTQVWMITTSRQPGSSRSARWLSCNGSANRGAEHDALRRTAAGAQRQSGSRCAGNLDGNARDQCRGARPLPGVPVASPGSTAATAIPVLIQSH